MAGFALNLQDLSFILDQIRIAERHAQTGELVDAMGAPIDRLTPWGLRTVSGQFNNLLDTTDGSSGLPMPRLLNPVFRVAQDTSLYGQQIGAGTTTIDTNGPAPGGQVPFTTNYGATSGYVVDGQPRTISNLVVDQSVRSPVALSVALQTAGMGAAEALAYARDFSSRYGALLQGLAPQDGIEPLRTAVSQATQVHGDALVRFDQAQAAVESAQAALSGLAAAQAALSDARTQRQEAQTALAQADAALQRAVAQSAAAADEQAARTLQLTNATTVRDTAQTSLDNAESALAGLQSTQTTMASLLQSARANAQAAETAYLDAASIAANPSTPEGRALLDAIAAREQAQATLAEAEGRVLAAQQAVAAAQQGVATADAALAVALGTAGSTGEALAVARAEYDAALAQRAVAADALAAAQAITAAAQTGLDTAQDTAARLAVELASAQQTLEDAQAAHDATLAALPALQQAALDAQAALADALAVLAQREGERDAAAAALEQAVIDEQAAFEAIAPALASGDRTATAAALLAWQQASDALASSQLAAAEAAGAVVAAQEEVTVARTAADAAVGTAEAAQAAVADWPAQRSGLQAEVDARASDVTAAQERVQAAEAALQIARDAEAAPQSALEAADGRLAAADTGLASATAAGELASAAVASAQAELTAARQALVAAENGLILAIAGQQDATQALAAAQAGEAAARTAYEEANGLSLFQTWQAALSFVLTLTGVQSSIDAQVASAQAARDRAASDLDGARTVYDAAQAAMDAADRAVADAADQQADAQRAHADAVASAGRAEQAVADAQAQLDAFADEIAALDAALADLAGAQAGLADADAALSAAQRALDAAIAAQPSNAEALQAMLQELRDRGVVLEGTDPSEMTVVIPNVMPDLGDTAPYNSFFTLFGQFFDHGLDLVSKGGSGTVYIPLQPDDPLYAPGSPTNFMVLTRATNQPGPDGVLGTADDVREHTNETTPWIDLNQVYASHESHQVFLREYVRIEVNGQMRTVATGHMLEGATSGPPTWADIKAQAREMLGIELTDADVERVPLVAADLYGNFLPDANGFAQLVVVDPASPTGYRQVSGTPDAPVAASQAVSAGRAFLNDIAHDAAPVANAQGVLQPDADVIAGNDVPADARGNNLQYDDELLGRHFVVGDGRGNENIGLTAVHTVFHSEHNHRVDQIKDVLLAQGDVAALNEWLLVPVQAMPDAASADALPWNGERLFQAARFSTEMVYQHLVFEEFARLVSPDIDPFVFSNTVTVSGDIVAEFAHVVYRFGHSMLNENVDRIAADGQTESPIGLIEAFLNPIEFDASGADAAEAAGAIIRGMTRQVGNEIDEWITGALRNNLVGLPLDLAALNIARGRETGVPSLNEARRQFFEQTGDTRLEPYSSWADLAQNIKHPASIVNFVAAYGTHASIVSATTLEAKRDAAFALVLGGSGAPADRLDFLNATGAYAGGSLGGLNDVDFWIGGLAEAKMAFGGLLGSTFNFVFEVQMERLQAADRFYYLSRTQGQNLLNELEADSFAALVMRNTDLGDPNATHLPSSIFLTPAYILELEQSRQRVADPINPDPVLGAITPAVIRRDTDGDGADDYLRYTGGEHVVLGGTQRDDTLIGGAGDDTLWGDGGNDRLEGGLGVDHLFGGEGDDVITDAGNDIGAGDVIHGDGGNDVINGGIGLDLIFGGDGNDFIFGGSEAKDITAGEGDDFVSGPTDSSFLKGNEGDDWIEGGAGGAGLDTLAGDNSELFFNSEIIGHDVLNGRDGDNDYDAESGDDIMVQGAGIERNNGMAGFDWAIHKGGATGADSDLGVPIFVNQQANILRDRFDLVEGLSGWRHDDRLTGRDVVVGAYDEAAGAAAQFDPTAPFASYSNALTQAGVDRIAGLDAIVGHLARETFTIAGRQETVLVFDDADVQRDAQGNAVTMFDAAHDILLGGGGSDVMQGKAGNDVIDGDRWLNVRIRISDAQGTEIGSADSMTGRVYDNATGATLFGGRTLDQLMLDRTLNPGQLSIVREILDGDPTDAGTDTAVFRGNLAEYDIVENDDGSFTVAHARPADPAVDDGTDRVFNVERLQFADAVVARPTLDLHAFDAANYRDTFSAASYANSNGSAPWTTSWIESGDRAGSVATSGEVRVNQNALEFRQDSGTGATPAGASITRGVDLSKVGSGTATLSFSYDESNLDPGESVLVQFAADGVNFTTLRTLDGSANSGTASLDLAGPFTANAAIRFVFSGVNGTGGGFNFGGETVRIDNVDVSYRTPSNDGGTGWAGTFTEDGAAVGVTSVSGIGGSTTLAGAQVVLTNAQAGDSLTASTANGRPAGIAVTTTSENGVLTLTLSGTASAADYQRALDSVRFTNASQAPDTTPRVVEVTVADASGLVSRPAVATISVVAVDDPMIAADDSVVTNVAANTAFSLNVADLLANDVDPDGTTAITAITGQSGLASTPTLNLAAGTVTVADNGTANGSFVYRGTGTDTATVSVTRDTSGTLDGTGGADVIVGNAAGTVIDGNGGRDVIYGGGGNDTFDYNATGDVVLVNGGAQGGVDGATVQQLEVIRDFAPGDRIDLSDIDARAGFLDFGNQAFTFVGQAAFTGANQNGGLRYSHVTDASGQAYTVIEASTDNDANAEFQLALLGQHTLTSGDFVL